MSFNLLNIGTSGVRASSELLQTTSKNITNINTKGYIRERTEHASMINNQVSRGDTVRLLNEFAQKQLNRDISNQAYYHKFVEEASRVDALFSEQSNSLNTNINALFNSLQEAMNLPSSQLTRNLFLTEAQNLTDQMNRISGLVFDQNNIANEQLNIFSEEANALIETISTLNQEVASLSGGDSSNADSAVLNERDEAIKELSKLVDIETLDGPEGKKLVFLGSGQALVMENGTFNTFSTHGDPDPNIKELVLDVTDGKAIPLSVDSLSLKGKIGGLIAFRNEVLQPAQNKLGQIGIALADAFNQQNKLGMDLEGNLGADLFSIPSVGGYSYSNNTGTASVSATLESGLGQELPASDFKITFTSATTVEIRAIDGQGNVIGSPSTANVVAGKINAASMTGGTESFGLEIDVSGTATVDDSFVIKLNSGAASQLKLVTDRPQNIALASPIRTSSDPDNVSNATISPGVVTSTDPASSGFTAGTPPSLTNGPIEIEKTANPNEYTIYDANHPKPTGLTFAITPPADNVLSQAGAPYNSYGFDFNIDGEPATGDIFKLEFNTGGVDDNRNGMVLSELQNTGLVRDSVITSAVADNVSSFNESYVGLVTEVGVVTHQAITNAHAYDALATQSEAWFESMSGVNLDEEASNLLRFQQAYSASAQIITAAKNIFDTLLNAAR